MPKNFLLRFKRIDFLISRKATGKPAVFSQKLGISESMLYEYLAILKQFGAPIKYDLVKQTYFYEYEGEFVIDFKKK